MVRHLEHDLPELLSFFALPRHQQAQVDYGTGTTIARIAAALARDYFLFRIRSPARLVPPFDSRVPCSCEA